MDDSKELERALMLAASVRQVLLLGEDYREPDAQALRDLQSLDPQAALSLALREMLALSVVLVHELCTQPSLPSLHKASEALLKTTLTLLATVRQLDD